MAQIILKILGIFKEVKLILLSKTSEIKGYAIILTSVRQTFLYSFYIVVTIASKCFETFVT